MASPIIEACVPAVSPPTYAVREWDDDKVRRMDRRHPTSDIVLVLEPDPVIEAYKKDVDRTLLRENLKLTPDERLRKLQAFMNSLEVLQQARRRR